MNLKILKLRSGEEIACQVLEENENDVKVYQPMLFKTTSSVDVKGRIVDVTTLHDWLVNTDDKNVNIPVNHIAFTSIPNKDTTKLYIMESEKEFNPKNFVTEVQEKNIDSIGLTPEGLNFTDLIDDLLSNTSDLMKSIERQERPPSRRSKKKKKDNKTYLPPDMTDENELDRHMIMMQLYIPAESIMNLITAGLIEPQVLLNIIDEVKKRNRFTGDEKNRKDFGNNFSDWNPDPNSGDY
jgi:hypothetical protein